MAMASDETINSNNLDEISNHDFNLNGPRLVYLGYFIKLANPY